MIWNDSLYTDNYPDMVRFAYKRLNDYQRAEDAVQRTFAQAVDHNIDSIDTANGVRRWLFTSLRNHLVDSARRNILADRALRAAHPGAKFNTEGEYLAIDLETPESTLLMSEAALEVHATLDTLPSGVRNILVRYYIWEQSVPEIMKKTGKSNASVKSALMRGRQAFAQAQPDSSTTRKKALVPVSPEHGMPINYKRFGCRCRPCMNAHQLWAKKRLGYREVYRAAS